MWHLEGMATDSKPLILIVEDEKELAAQISDHLEMSEMATMVYNQARNVARFLSNNFVNLLLLDINLPDSTGFALLEELKKNNIDVPVIFLTASNSEIDKVKALDMGGDDYITKPFSFPELIARIKAVLRRTETARDQLITQNVALTEEPFSFCGATINPIRLELDFPDGSTIKIGRKAIGIIICLVSNKGKVITRRSLIHSVWGVHADVRSRSMDQYIVKIRSTFEKHGCDLKDFRTIHGIGYTYEPEDQDATETSAE